MARLSALLSTVLAVAVATNSCDGVHVRSRTQGIVSDVTQGNQGQTQRPAGRPWQSYIPTSPCVTQRSGSCINRDSEACSGSFESGLCPGPSAIVCCVASSGNSQNENSSQNDNSSQNSGNSGGWMFGVRQKLGLNDRRGQRQWQGRNPHQGQQGQQGQQEQQTTSSTPNDANMNEWNDYLSKNQKSSLADFIPAPMAEHFGVFCPNQASTSFNNKANGEITWRPFHPNGRFNQLTPAFKKAVFVSPECTPDNTFGVREWPAGANAPTNTIIPNGGGSRRPVKGLPGFTRVLDEVFNAARAAKGDGFMDQLKQAGGLYCKKPALARSGIASFSNHAYGLAVDLFFGERPQLPIQRGIAELAQFMTARNVKWQLDDDGMHFDASQELVRQWVEANDGSIPENLLTNDAKNNRNNNAWWDQFKCKPKMNAAGISLTSNHQCYREYPCNGEN
eukprot:TRINITY_DN3582_c2_g1_i1.p1 TRINITY_DN3582_c2_g1~~TRINITY_DN3582_c2_g1_i1.p1  ORF type:complete len:482 (-),score=112.33 TRINITY_DN3582_c2_g1_i1:91-1437(-)